MKFLRMRPGFGEQLIAEGDLEVAEEEQALIEEFRRQLDQGMWAAVPTLSRDGRREAAMVRRYAETKDPALQAELVERFLPDQGQPASR